MHFFRDNPNVPSDLEMMPNLLNFIEGNGTLLSNNHTPLIAHTADDILTTLTGLYGDRQGMPISNSYQTYNPDGTTDPAGSFAYWTDPVFDTASHAERRATTPTRPWSTRRPRRPPRPRRPSRTRSPRRRGCRSPGPGCDVGRRRHGEHGAGEHRGGHPQGVRRRTRPRRSSSPPTRTPFKDAETADYVGVAVHCAQGSAFCANAQGVKFGQTTPSPHRRRPTCCPTSPAATPATRRCSAHRYVAPQLGAGTPNLTHNGYQVTNAAGQPGRPERQPDQRRVPDQPPRLPRLRHHQRRRRPSPTWPTCRRAGVPVTYGYISDIHGNEHIPALGPAAVRGRARRALGSGSACYIAQAQYYNQAFGTFFQRLAADGITPQNTLFVFSSDEGDHEAGANVGRAIQPTPANCDGATVSGDTVTPDVLCTYPAGTFGELAGNLTGLLATQKNNTTPFTLETDTAPEFYVTGNPGRTRRAVRTLEHDVGGAHRGQPVHRARPSRSPTTWPTRPRRPSCTW